MSDLLLNMSRNMKSSASCELESIRKGFDEAKKQLYYVYTKNIVINWLLCIHKVKLGKMNYLIHLRKYDDNNV